uniref:NADH-ubiquinone oxidoreductase chain 2 n=1 Tax=Margarinotus merdarius TaxID=878136 RepID=A0A0S2M7L7_MARMD|nr:NADH dehydrogenase subunit 2 [Margarinotus merdarius]ALO70683.1 NADH deshydrogenase subunit 2 [Margarinotus merdarius]
MFLVTLVLGSLISVSSSTWLGIWMGLEINLLSMIPLMTSPLNAFSNESAIKYFITQALASAILMFTVLGFETMGLLTSTLLMESVLFTKMGAAPFHFWFPEVMEGLNWSNSLILMTWQKLAPMVILSYLPLIPSFTLIVIAASMTISGIMGINQSSLRKIMAFSSINHIGWMLSTIMFVETIWTLYFTVYSLISSAIVFTLHSLNISHVKQLFTAFDNNNTKLLFSLNFFSLGGMPPFLGFMPKWMAIQSLIDLGMVLTTLVMIILTLIPLYYYIRLTIASMVLQVEIPLTSKNKLNSMLPAILNGVSVLGLIVSSVLFNFL